GKENGVDEGAPLDEGEKADGEGKDGSEKDDNEKEDKDEEKGDDDSSDDDDLTVTIGALKTQPDIVQAPSAARFQPKAAPTTGLKDEDFTSPGKVNGVPVPEFTFDMEDKPWRKPGADISDYFNYGFNEETWFKYCDRQKRMRVTESGAGLSGLGVSVTKPFGNTPSTNIPVAIINDNSKYGGVGRPKAGPPPRNVNKPVGQIDVISSKTSTIQVMTADRREYSSKVMNGPPPTSSFMPGYDDMEFGGNPYGDSYYPPPDTSYYGNPPPFSSITWAGGDMQGQGGNWEGGAPNVTPVSSSSNYFDESSNMSAPPPVSEQQEEERHRSRRSHRSRSRSPARHKHSSSRHRSRSRSPSHRHKRKKSKRERDAD
ncbi:hypothetical protein SK128_016999, partial [Halocaridina rubra]